MYPAKGNVTEANVTNVGTRNLNWQNCEIDYKKINYDFWIFIEGFLFIVITLGNVLTILAIMWSRKLRSIISNYLILNLAVSDLLVAITLMYHLAFYVNDALNHNKVICLLRFVILNIGCAGSIHNLIVIALDRYVAIVHPLSYNVYATRKHMLLIIVITWICTMNVSIIPIYWNKFDPLKTCELEEVLPRCYILTVQVPLFLLCWLTMFLLYWKIWKEAHMHRRRMKVNTVSHTNETNDRKSVQMVLLILGCFSISWLPFFIIVCLKIFGVCRTKLMIISYKSAFALAIANSGINPFIYAWKNANFRRAFQNILHFKSPNLNSSFKVYLEKQHQLKRDSKEQTHVKRDYYTNGNNNSYLFDQQFNHTEENGINSTTL